MITTLLPNTSAPATSAWELLSFDSFAHAFLFCVLTFLMIVGMKKQYTFVKTRHYAIRYSLFICTFYGIGIELLQEFVLDGREGDIFDVLSNTIGCLSGILLFKWVYKQ
ncbi:VanZ family protein [Pontibacter qinzhouensis]|uniref:VanZ family protein n=1 Tax=Pontibacter qinzhouensis TaxID=2603253 RepID=A0A5C8K9Z4_9BACT|nr:VanZ family protein [Pontibacter qinzhouensis]